MARKRKVPAANPNKILEESENGGFVDSNVNVEASVATTTVQEDESVVPNSTVDLSISQNPMYSIMTNAQLNDLFHNKFIKEMQKLYEKTDHESFVQTLTHMIKVAMAGEEKNEYSESTLVFCAKYAASYATEDTHPVLLYLFNWVLKTISSSPHIRFRLCQFVNMLLNALGLEAALDDNICDDILTYMMNRLRDLSPNVRLQAIVALQRLQCPDDPNDPVVKAYQFHLSSDPSSKVRQSVITSMGRNFNTIPFIIERLWDIDEKVRRHTYLHMSSYPVKAYLVIQRLTFLEQGLNDPAEMVRKVVVNVMLPQWLESYKRDILALLSALKIDATEAEIDRFRKAAKQLLPEVFKKEKDYEELIKFLGIDTESDFEFNKCIPFDSFSLELLVYWQSLVDFFIQKEANELDLILPEMTYMCSYITCFYSGQKTEMDKFEKMEFNYKLVSLFEIVLSMDFGDEFGKNQLMQLIRELINSFDLDENMVKIIVSCSEKCIEDPDKRLEFFSNLIQEILDLDKNKDIIEDRSLIDRLLEQNNDKDLKIKLSSLKVKLLDLEEQETNYVDRKDYVRAQKVAEIKSHVTEEYRGLLKPFLEQHNASTNIANSLQQTKRLTNEGILKCLQLTFFVVVSQNVTSLIPSILNLFKEFVRRHVESPNIIIREWALKCGSAFGILYDQLAKDIYEVLVSQFYKNQSLRLWRVSIDCIFEMLDRYGLEFFNDTTEGGDKTLRRNGRTLYNASNSLSMLENQEEEENTGNGTNFLHMMLNCMTTCDDAVVVRALVIGFCRLIVHGVITNPHITENLLLRYFNPASDIETNQVIGVFWEHLIFLGKQELLQPCVISTIKTILNAPHDSPLLEIKPELILRFVIISTRKLLNVEGLNVHNVIGLSFLKEIENSFANKELCKLLSKDLVNLELDFQNDPGLKRIMSNLCDKLLTCDLDPKVIKSIEEFKIQIHGLMSVTSAVEEEEQQLETVPEEEEEQPQVELPPPAAPPPIEEERTDVPVILSDQPLPPTQELAPIATSTQNPQPTICRTPSRDESISEVTTPTTFGVENTTTLRYLRKSMNNTKDRDTPTSNIDENEKSIGNINKTAIETPKRNTRKNKKAVQLQEEEALNVSEVIVATPSPVRDTTLRRRAQAPKSTVKKLPEPAKTPENNRRSGSKRTLSMAQTPNPNPVQISEKISPQQKQQKTIETDKETEFLRKSTEAVREEEDDDDDESDEEEEEVSPLQNKTETETSNKKMSESLSVETRSRSRSKTPFLRSQCDHENCTITEDGQHVHSEKKRTSTAPKVGRISEEKESVQKKQNPTLVMPKTSDYSSEDDHSFERRNNIQKSAVKVSSSTSTITTRTSTHKTTSSSSTKNHSSNEHLAETITSPIPPPNVKEIRRIEAKIKTSTPIDYKKSSNRTMSADSSSSNDLNNSDSLHFAYQEYHDAGEYWNKTQKTDYTYSKLSPHRRHLKQGEIAMPNMSRRSLEQHTERVNLMVARNPEQEEFIRRRYEQIDYARLRKNREYNLAYDSTDELDVVESEIKKRYTRNNHHNMYHNRYESESWITRFVTRVVTVFYNFVGIFIGSKDEEYLYSNRIPEQKGVISRVFSSITSFFVNILRSLYMGISSILYYDTYLLRSSAPENRNKKRFLLLLLLLLPLLLLTAWNLMDEQEQTTYLSYYKNSISNLLPSLSLPLTLTQFLKSPKLDLTSSQSTNGGRMTSEEYDSLLHHINTYIQMQLEEKSVKQQHEINLKVTKDLSLIISEKLKEQKVTSDIDIEKIVDAVYQKLSDNPLKFHPENIIEIQRLVKTHSSPSTSSTSSASSEEIDSIVMRILNAPQLSQFIDNRIVITADDHSQHHKTAIDGLTAEIELIKRILDEKIHENKELRGLLSELRINQDGLSERIDANEAFTKEELARMLILIDEKITNLNERQFAAINVQIKKSLGEIFGYKKDIEQLDLENWIKSLFVAKELLEERLVELSKNTDIKIKEEIERSGTILMEVISDKLKKEILLFIKEREKSGTVTLNLGEEEIRRIVKSVLAIYDADKTGMVDYALESAGGQILSTRCTESYQTKTAQISVLGIPLWYPSNTPRIAISPNVQPGECWAFSGFPGYLVLRLNSFVHVTGFTMEHIPKSLAPTGRIDSAPRNFTVWGLQMENDQEPEFFGEYEYKDNGISLQYFSVQNKDITRPYQIIELRVESNHGHQTYTCLYRFRVHGKTSNF
ncbi:NCAPG family protein [Megaselia abdita]